MKTKRKTDDDFDDAAPRPNRFASSMEPARTATDDTATLVPGLIGTSTSHLHPKLKTMSMSGKHHINIRIEFSHLHIPMTGIV